MFCKYCGNQLKESAQFCDRCGENVKPIGLQDHQDNHEAEIEAMVGNQELSETSSPELSKLDATTPEPTPTPETTLEPTHKPIQGTYNPPQNLTQQNETKAIKPRRKKHKFLLGFITPIIILVILMGVFLGSIFFGDTDYQAMIEKVPRDWQVYSQRQYDDSDEMVITTIDIGILNGYLNSRNNLKAIDAPGYKVLNICLDQRKPQLYLRVKNGNMPEVNVVADYKLTLENDKLNFQITPTEVGWNFPVISALMLKLYYDIESISIPLNSELSELDDYFFVDYLVGKEGLGSIKRGSLVMAFDVSGHNIDEDAKSISEIVYTKPEVIRANDEKYIEIKEDYLVAPILLDETVLSRLAAKNIKGDYLVNQNNQILLRMNDQASGLYYDIDLSFEYDMEQDTLQLKSANYGQLTQLSERSLEALIAAFNEGLSERPIGYKDQYTITRTDYQDDVLKLYIEQSSWTVLVYMNGSDLESSIWNGELLGMGTSDLNEMMAGVDDQRVNVVVETGGTLEWSNSLIDASQNQRWQVTDQALVHLEDLGMKNMCEPETLVDFITYGVSNYPAENYALVFWNHGGGAIYGFGYDEYFPYDSLTLDEIVYAFDTVESQLDFKFEVIGFDACLMATVETAITFEPYANYLIASQETEPDYGWDYEYVFGNLSDGTVRNGEDFGEIVVAGFREDSVNKNMADMLTLSVIDLSKTEALVDAVNNLFIQINGSYEGIVRINEVVPVIKAFGGNTESSGYTDHYDLEHFAKKLIEFWPNEANELVEAINDSVKYKFSGYLATDAGGLSFYLPYYDLYSRYDVVDSYEPMAISDTYLVFMEDFYDYRELNINATSEIEYYVDFDVDPYTITFDPATYDQVQWVYLNVYEVFSDEYGYYYMDLGYDAWVYQTYDLYTYEDGFGKWAAIDGEYMPLTITYDSASYIEFETPILLNGEKAMMITAYIYEDGSYLVYGARPFNEAEIGVIDRNLIEFQPGDEIVMIYDVYDDYDWLGEFYSDPVYVGSTGVPIIEEIVFESGYTYGVQFVIIDVNGSLTYSDYMEFTWN